MSLADLKHIMLSHRQLIHALTLSKYGNFTRAAEAENISQSAFSRSISKLENSLGVPLFDRDANHVVPTRYGEALLEKARTIAADTVELQREIKLMRGLELGSFAVAMGIYPAEVSGNQALGGMLQRYPNLNYRSLVGNWETAIEHVLSNTVDLGFIALEAAENDGRLTIENVSQHEMAIYCRKGHPLAGRKALSRNDLDQFPLVSIRVPGGLAGAIPGKSEIDSRSGYLVPKVEVDDFSTARAVISNSDGIGAAIPLQIEAQLLSGEFILLNLGRPWLMPPHGFILLKQRSVSPAAEAFMEDVIKLEVDAGLRNRQLADDYIR